MHTYIYLYVCKNIYVIIVTLKIRPQDLNGKHKFTNDNGG